MPIPAGWNRDIAEVLKLALAYVLALPTGWQREREAHSVGVRTFPVVAMASCGYLLLGAPVPFSADSQARIIQGLVAGIGFIGGGAILKSDSHIRGTATAASIWCTGVVGVAVAQGRYTLAVTLSLLNWFTLRFLLPVKSRLDLDLAPGPDNLKPTSSGQVQE
jgi:putative Mg2+ transporter-C (MgtC) family protein